MLLEPLLDQPADSPHILFRLEPYGSPRREQLIRDIIGLANAAFDVPRYIVFGADGHTGSPGRRGLSEAELETVKADVREASRLIEPELQLAPVYSRIEGKFFAAVEIHACDNPPYVVKEDFSRRLRRGECWVRTGVHSRPVKRADLDRMYAQKAAVSKPKVQVGLSGDPAREVLELDMPDTGSPPSLQAMEKLRQSIEAKQAARQLNRDDTDVARLVHTRLYGADQPFVPRGMDTLVDGLSSVEDEYREADLYYFYEQQAIKLNLTVSNGCDHALEGAAIELSIPRTEDFDVAEHLVAGPAATASNLEKELAGYPQVHKKGNVITVRASLGDIPPGARLPVFECPLRLAVGPKMKGQKVAIRYALVAQGLGMPCRGRLKLKFRR